MALIQFALLLSIGLQAVTSTSGGLLSAPDAPRVTLAVCEDCTQTFKLLADLFSDDDIQKKVMNGIEGLCAHLPGPVSEACKDEVEKMFPLAITFITGFVKPAQVCKVLGLCGSCEERERMLQYFVKEALQAAVKNENQSATQCATCLYVFKTLEALVPKELIENAVIKQLQKVCNIVPFYQDQCGTIIEKYIKMMLEVIQSYIKPQTICTLIGMCKREDGPIQASKSLITYLSFSLRPMHNIQVQRHQDCCQVWNSVLLSEICLEVSQLQHTLEQSG
ncbi:hypothetical protein Q5P01_024654 [Channa striata]|uniref:Saposin B-type domain-containing protein n=1 Tax=Channa striata TaxID=64152 RepID=A0AA88IQQ0_CHASR|nr:hypothetical protein Q5P01_024654 [Channa striata]